MKKTFILATFLSCLILAGAVAAQSVPLQAPAGTQSQGPGPAGVAQDNQLRPNSQNLIPFPTEPYQAVGYSMELPYQIAAEILAQDDPSPKLIVDIGSYQGQFLQAFLQRFPAARGQWTEPVTSNEENAHRKLRRFGNRVDYVIGCPGRDIGQGCVPKSADVIITAWVTHHQPIDGIKRIYKLAYEQLPSNGWLVILDNISTGDADWERRLKLARYYFNPDDEGPPMETAVKGMAFPTLDQQVDAFKSAGFTDYAVVWKSFDMALIMAHKQ